jgi:mRNA interferase RelE/StbE
MLKLRLYRDAERFLQKIPTKHAQQIFERILALRVEPLAVPTEDIKGLAPFRRLKSGEYRIVFYIEGEELHITLIGKRNDDDIYKKLKR